MLLYVAIPNFTSDNSLTDIIGTYGSGRWQALAMWQRGSELAMFIQPIFLLTIFLSIVHGLHNVTVDSQSSLITYAPPGSWNQSAPSPLDAGGSHMLTGNSAATAVFNFTGIVIIASRVLRMTLTASCRYRYLFHVATLALPCQYGGFAGFLSSVPHRSGRSQ